MAEIEVGSVLSLPNSLLRIRHSLKGTSIRASRSALIHRKERKDLLFRARMANAEGYSIVRDLVLRAAAGHVGADVQHPGGALALEPMTTAARNSD